MSVKEWIFHGTISNPASVIVRAETPEQARQLLDDSEFDVFKQATHHIIEFLPDGKVVNGEWRADEPELRREVSA